jgi:chromosome partitioning protein
MGAMRESCSVCGTHFDVQFRYQMEERNGGFSFYCSQKCLQQSQNAGGNDDAVTCDACAKRFRVELVSQVLYLGNRRRYACSLDCRGQLIAEARGVRLGDLTANDTISTGEAEPASAPRPVPSSPLVGASAPAPTANSGLPPVIGAPAAPQAAPKPAAASTAVAVPVVPPPRTAVPTRVTPAGGPARPIAPQPQPKAPPADGLPRLLAIFNHKGGTGKTTTSVSIAAGLALRGKKVLLVDTDAQGNVAVSLDVKAERSLYHVLVMGLAGKDAITNVRPNLDLIPSNETLAAAELYLAGRQNRDRVLAGRLAGIVSQYDHVIVDCSPSLSLLNQNALCLVDSVLVPVACDYLSLVGMRQVIKTVKNVNQLLHHPVRIWGVLPTFYDARAKICNEALDHLRQHFGPRCLKPVRQAIRIKEAPAKGQTIFEFAPGTSPVEDYQHVVGCITGDIPLESNLVAPQQEIERPVAATAC